MRSSDRSSPASSRAAKATPRPTCSGIGDFRCPTLRWATRCSKNPNDSEWGSGFALPDQEAIARYPKMRHVANARMYSVNPQAASAWKELFAWLSRESGVELDVVDHAFPLPLSDLWSRADLACAFMCGFPFALTTHPPRPVAAPVPAKAPIPGRSVYAARLLLRADSEYFSIEDTFDRRVGYTVEDSHSGYNALRHHLLPYYRQRGGKAYLQSIGPLTTPRRVIEALLADDIDVGPLDGYALDLMLRHQAKLGSRVRVIAPTGPSPVPLLG